MRTVPGRSPLLVVAASLGCFAGGPFLGAAVAHLVAPGSETAQWLTPLAFFVVFAGGMLLWFGVGALAFAGGGVLRLFRFARGKPNPPTADGELVPPGYGLFVPLAVVLTLLAGGVAAFTSDAGLFGTCIAYAAFGSAWGFALRALAHRGYLPFPEPA